MKKILFIFILSISLSTMAQGEFIEFLKSDKLPHCFKGLNESDVERLMEQSTIQARNTTFRMDYDHFKNVMYLETSNHCDDIYRIHMKLIFHKEREYVFMYKERVKNSDSYGRLRVYRLDDDEWQEGRTVEVTWQQLFNLNDRDLNRLRNIDKYPQYMLSFEERNIVFEIPWRLYTFEEGSENNAFSKAGGKQPVKFPYHYFLSSN